MAKKKTSNEIPRFRADTKFFDGARRHKATKREPKEFSWPRKGDLNYKDPSLTFIPLNDAAEQLLNEYAEEKKQGLPPTVANRFKVRKRPDATYVPKHILDVEPAKEPLVKPLAEITPKAAARDVPTERIADTDPLG